MEGRINWRARYGSVNTSGSLTILENTFLPKDNIYTYIKKRRNIVSHGKRCFEGRSCSSLGPKDGQRLWGEEKSYVSLDSRFLKKLSSIRARIHDTISFFFFLNRCMDFLEKRGKGKIFMEIGNLFRSVTIGDSLDCETLAYLSDNLNVSCGRIYNVFKTILFRCF